MSKTDVSDIKKLVAGTFVQQTCSVTRNSLDSICISLFLGLTMTGIYNNYFLIITGITSFISLISHSFMGGIGNHVATRSVHENYQEMKKLDFVYLWISGWCAICLLCLYQPFMKLWMGEKMLLPMPSVVLLCLYFYLLKLGDVRWMYSSAKGLWWEQRFKAIGETLLNLILNITLGKLYGINGIISATMISIFFCSYIWSTRITFRLYFSIENTKDYYYNQAIQTVIMVIAGGLTYMLCSGISTVNMVIQIVLRSVICLIVPNVIFYIAYRNSESLQYAKKIIFRRG